MRASSNKDTTATNTCKSGIQTLVVGPTSKGLHKPAVTVTKVQEYQLRCLKRLTSTIFVVTNPAVSRFHTHGKVLQGGSLL